MPTTKLNNGQLPTTLSSKTIDNSNDINTTTTRLKISGGSNGQVLSTDGSSNLSWTTAGGGVSDGDKGDITVASSGTVWTIDNDAVTYAKMQNVSATNRLLGRATAGSGNAEEITIGSGLKVSGTTLSALAPTAIITKTADETVTSSITAQDDDELTYNLTANKRYFWQLFMLMSRVNTSGTPQLRYQINTNGTGYWRDTTVTGLGNLYTTTGVTLVADTAAGVPTIFQIYGTIRHTSNTALTFAWAQRTSSTTGTTIHAGSQLIIWEVT